ncbi:MAG: hypothetical protein AAF915_12175 [Cyanobacteria bacterium P01_D01_bin.50]
MKFTNLTISCVVFFFSVTSAAIAQTTEEKLNKINEEIEILKKEKEKIDAEINLETQKKALLKLKLPTLAVDKNIEEKITFENLEIERKISVHRAIEKVADKAQKEIINHLGSDISLIFDDSDYVLSLLKSQSKYKYYKDTVNKLKKDYRKLGIVSVSDVGTVVESLFDYFKLFRTTKDFKGSSIEMITQRAFIAKLANKLRKNHKSVSLYKPNKNSLISGDAINEIIGELNELKQYQKRTENISSSEANKELKDFRQELKKFLDRFTISGTESDKEKIAFLSSILEYATFQNIKNKGKVYFLSIEKIKAGNTIRNTKNIFTSRLRFSGGVIINYIVYDYDKAEIVFSNLHNEYTGFKKIRSSK